MAGSVNMALILGRLGKDPEVRNTQAGLKIVSLSVATDRSWMQNGERKKETEWHKIVVFNERAAEFAERYLKKGASVHIQGEIKTRKWTDQAGAERYSTEIIIPKFGGSLTSVGPAPDRDEEPGQQAAGQASRQPARTARDELDDEVPF